MTFINNMHPFLMHHAVRILDSIKENEVKKKNLSRNGIHVDMNYLEMIGDECTGSGVVNWCAVYGNLVQQVNNKRH